MSKMDATMYEMMSYQSTELYPQQVIPVITASTDNYTLPTPPHSPSQQFTDLSGPLMGAHSRHFGLDPPQTFPTDLSTLSDNLDSYLPDLFSCPFTSASAYTVLPDTEEFGQVPSPTPSPVYTYDYQHETFTPTNYVPQGRSFAGSVGDDSDQEGNFSDDTMQGSSQASSHSSRRHEDIFTPSSLFHGGAAGDPQRTHNYQRKTDTITMSELVGLGSNNGGRMKQKPQKRRPTTSPDSTTKGIKKSSRGKGRREAMKGNHLWEFIRDLLKNKTTCPRIIRWENRQEGVFRFVNSEAVAGLWGTKKNNPNMNYEKLSRAMRYYYKREILERVDGRRLVYKFGCNADGWREAAAEATQDD